MKEPFEIECPECSQRFFLYDEEDIQNYLSGIEILCPDCQDELENFE
jgi:hypothetical protein